LALAVEPQPFCPIPRNASAKLSAVIPRVAILLVHC
jgi:hypothetical protein